MSIILNKHTIQGIRGRTVVYTLADFQFDETTSRLRWNAFRFYTPVGDRTDEDGFNYFDIPADEVLIERDTALDKDFTIVISSGEVTVIYILEGATGGNININGLEGDIIASGIIPCDTSEDITIDYKEVICV
jgi:hypothetical protein